MGACIMYMFSVHIHRTKLKDVKYQNWNSRENTFSLGTFKVYQMMIFEMPTLDTSIVLRAIRYF